MADQEQGFAHHINYEPFFLIFHRATSWLRVRLLHRSLQCCISPSAILLGFSRRSGQGSVVALGLATLHQRDSCLDIPHLSEDWLTGSGSYQSTSAAPNSSAPSPLGLSQSRDLDASMWPHSWPPRWIWESIKLPAPQSRSSMITVGESSKNRPLPPMTCLIEYVLRPALGKGPAVPIGGLTTMSLSPQFAIGENAARGYCTKDVRAVELLVVPPSAFTLLHCLDSTLDDC